MISEKCSGIIEKNAGTRRKGDRFRGHAWNRPNFNAGSRSWNIRFDRFTALAAIVRFIARGNGIVRGRFTRPPIDCLTPIFFPPPLFFLFFSSRHSFFSPWIDRTRYLAPMNGALRGNERNCNPSRGMRVWHCFRGFFFFQRCKDNGIFFHEEKSLFLLNGKIRWIFLVYFGDIVEYF